MQLFSNIESKIYFYNAKLRAAVIMAQVVIHILLTKRKRGDQQ